MGIEYNITLDDNSTEILREFEERKKDILYIMGNESQTGIIDTMSEADSTGKDIVQSGRLRASISFVTPDEESGRKVGIPTPITATQGDLIKGRSAEDSAIVGSNVEYASFVNNGTSKQAPRTFIQRGIERKQARIQFLIEKKMKGEL